MADHRTNTIRILHGIQDVADKYELVICDLWGVIHNGISAHHPAIEAIEKLRGRGCTTVFLSNAPRPRGHVRQQLIGMGVPAGLTDHIVTSGGLARDAVRTQWAGKKLYHLGPSSDRNTVEGLDVEEVSSTAEADVILATGLEFNSVEKHRASLAEAAARKVPFLCANPDRVVHVGEKLYLCAGSIADLYAEMAGPVEWFGKPTAAALLSCAHECGIKQPPHHRCIMVGDSLQTDVAGARAAGFHSLFIAAGIHREDWPSLLAGSTDALLPDDTFADVLCDQKPRPTYISETLRW